jgi:hypothetical protein
LCSQTSSGRTAAYQKVVIRIAAEPPKRSSSSNALLEQFEEASRPDCALLIVRWSASTAPTFTVESRCCDLQRKFLLAGADPRFVHSVYRAFVGTASVDNRVWRYRSADQARDANGLRPQSGTAQPTSAPTIGEQSKAWTTRSDEKGTVSYEIVFRKGALIATVTTAGTTSASFEDTVR